MNPPTHFRFELDAWAYEYHSVDLKADILVCRAGDDLARFAEPFTVRPTAEQWQEFWQAVERARVWEWQREYYNVVLDGTGWSLKLHWAGKRIRSEGSNGFPLNNEMEYEPDSEFGIFEAAVRQLVGSRKRT